MKKKRVILIIIIVGILLLGIGVALFINNKRNVNIQKGYKTYFSNSIDNIQNNKKLEDINSKKDKNYKIINNYVKDLKSKKDDVEKISYDNFIKSEDLNNTFNSLDEMKQKLEKNKESLNTKVDEFLNISSKKYLDNYLDKNRCGDLCKKSISRISKMDKLDNQIKKYKDDNINKFDNLLNYVNYLIEYKDSWFIENDIVTVKNDEVLNTINSKNQEFSISVTTQKYVEPVKVETSTSSTNTSSAHNLPVFMYHGVSDSPWGITSLFMPTAKFDEQMKYLHDNGYKTIFASEIDSMSDYSKTVVLTFDDGYEDFYLYAFPILKKYNIKANLYVISDYMNEVIYATRDEIKELSDSGIVEIGSHTATHNSLNQLSNEKIEEELKRSKEALESLTGKKVTSIAYPKGHYDDRVLELTKKYYNYAFLVNGGVQPMDDSLNRVAIKRIGVYSSITQNGFISYCQKAS